MSMIEKAMQGLKGFANKIDPEYLPAPEADIVENQPWAWLDQWINEALDYGVSICIELDGVIVGLTHEHVNAEAVYEWAAENKFAIIQDRTAGRVQVTRNLQ
jgi:hypothetical protein